MARKKAEERLAIRDPLLEPYEIVVDSAKNYILKDPTKFASGQTIGYYNDVQGALKKAIQLKISDRAVAYTLREYLNELIKLKNEINEVLKVYELE